MQNSAWCLVGSKSSIIAHCDIRNVEIIKKEMIHCTKEHATVKVMPE